MRRAAAVLFALVLIAAGCGDDDTSSTSSSSTSSSNPATSSPPATVTSTPAPDDDTAAAITAGVDVVYPGVPDGKAVDWARSSCRDRLDGLDDEQLVGRIVQRFAGGARPDPTPAQAEQILELLELDAWCVPA